MADEIAGVLFDKDGTLFDFEKTFAPACARTVLELANGDFDLARALGDSVDFDIGRVAFQPTSIVIAGCAADIAACWAPILKIADDAAFHSRIDGLFERHCRDTATLFPTVLPVLDRLERVGLAAGIATNDAEANARSQAQAASIHHRLSFIAGYDSGHGAKPGPGMVNAFARHLGVAPDRIVMVGDSTHDMAAARAAGAVGVAVTTGMADADQLAGHADHVIASLDDLLLLPQFAAIAARER
ncbi:MAG: HAD family hydrolase [Nitratireductor sp.]|nr:HAD family hydrolase [Nitratireductor sp.]